MKEPICELYHDNFQNYKNYGIPHAQIVIADIPYNIGAEARCEPRMSVDETAMDLRLTANFIRWQKKKCWIFPAQNNLNLRCDNEK